MFRLIRAVSVMCTVYLDLGASTRHTIQLTKFVVGLSKRDLHVLVGLFTGHKQCLIDILL